VELATVPRLLTKRTYIAPVLAAALAFPAASLAGGAETPSIGLSAAKPISISKIAPSVAHFHHTIRVVKKQIRAARRAEQRRERREVFAGIGISQATLDAIGSCESGGDPTAVSSDGTYRGKYQFDFGTWESVGGSGDPAAAAEDEQDYRAALLYAQSGSSPWPVCG
jgi:Transglycosylase-like domain